MNRKDILERLRERPQVFDGAMGTMLYARGVFINACYEQLCLTRPDLVREIHRAYVEAGADVIETDSFGANRVKLRRHGLAGEAAAINRAAAELARAEAGEEVLVAGSVGPVLDSRRPFQPRLAEELEEIYREQLTALAEGGVDFFLLETFTHPEEARLAARVARSLDRPVLVSMTFGIEGETQEGAPIEHVLRLLDEDENIDILGLNCGVGPAAAYVNAERALPLISKPLVVMPNAGLPREVDGRMIYLASPEYFTEYAKRMIELGVRGVGGCCGTTPEDIAVMARAVKALSGVKRHVRIATRAERRETPGVEPVPTERKSRFAAKLVRGEKVSSVEITPPRSTVLEPMLEKCRRCKEAGVDAINIPDGPRASARISPLVAALTIERETGIETILHYCCRDRNLIGMQSDLLGGYAAGLRNYLIITGDPPKLGDYPESSAVFDVDAIGLVRIVDHLNHGVDIGGNPIVPPTAILIGVGANPCAVEPEREMRRYLEKIEAGAEFAITQPVFDPDALLRFLDEAEARGAHIPVVAGVWPLVSYRNAEFLAREVPGVEVPDAVLERMSRAKDKEDARKIGVEIAREIRDAIADRVAGYQVSAPFGQVELALQVLAD